MYDIENALRRRAMLERLEARDRAQAATDAATASGDTPEAEPSMPAPTTAVPTMTVPSTTVPTTLPSRPVPTSTPPSGAPADAAARPGGAYEAPVRAAGYRNGAEPRFASHSPAPDIYDQPASAVTGPSRETAVARFQPAPAVVPGSPSAPGDGDGMSPLHDDLSRRYPNGSPDRDQDGAISSVQPPVERAAPAGPSTGTSVPEVDDHTLAVHLAAWQAITGLAPGDPAAAVPAAPASPSTPVPPLRPLAIRPGDRLELRSEQEQRQEQQQEEAEDAEGSTAATIADLLRQGGSGLFFRPGEPE